MMTSVILYPSPGMGHLISMVELGKLIQKQYPGCSITILTHNPPFNTGSTAAYISHVSSTVPSIKFHRLPFISLPHDLDSYPSMETIIFELILLSNPHVHQALLSISSTATTTSVFIIDFFCTPALSIATALNIPTYYFFTSGAYALALFQYLPILHKNTTENFKDTDALIHIPYLPPIPSPDMPMPLLDRTWMTYSFFLDIGNNFQKSRGIIVNTFESLEYKVIRALSDGVFVPDHQHPTPPLFCLGPLIASSDQRVVAGGGSGGRRHECLKWLDEQPGAGSVVYLCFGSLGLFSAEQLKEIAKGLERSGQRFLWVVRSPPSEDKSGRFIPPPEPDLDSLLLEGFLERTKDRGLVVKSWVPQVEVLSHEAVGGFVTHCGWNSVLEAVCAGVPMVAWPLYAEQKINRVFLVEEMKLAIGMKETDGESGFVTADVISETVKELMLTESLLRERVQAKKEEARQAMSDGGSSVLALSKLVESWK